MTRFFIVVLLAVGACKKATPVANQMDGMDGSNVQDIGLDLQAVAIAPAEVAVQTPTSARVYGAGFNKAARVSVGEIEVSGVTWQDKNTLQVQLPGLASGVYDLTVTNPDGRASTLRSGLSVRDSNAVDCRNTLVYFGLNQAGLTSEARGVLSGRTACLNASGAPIDIEGHADERGTTDYNVSLGQRRAKSVVSYLQSQGVSASRAKVVSWGEERPTDRGHTESAWAKNRRVEVRLH